jgi:hypothetical protein
MNSIKIGNTTILINTSYTDSVTMEQQKQDRLNLEDAALHIVEEMMNQEKTA